MGLCPVCWLGVAPLLAVSTQGISPYQGGMMDIIWDWITKNPQDIPLYLIVSVWVIQNMVMPFLKILSKEQTQTAKAVDFARESDQRHDEAINKLLEVLGRNLVALGDTLTALKDVGVRQMNVLEEVRDTTTAHRREFNDGRLAQRVSNIENALQAQFKTQRENRQLLVYLVKSMREKQV